MLSRTAGLFLLTVVPAIAFVLPAQPPAAGAAAGKAEEYRLSVPGTPSPAHLRLFTPRGAPAGAYVVTVMPSPMAVSRPEVMRAMGVVEETRREAGVPARGPWPVRRLEVAEAFGASGPYEAVRLARLFNGRRAEVSRGPVVRAGRAVASVTLISPYPDAALSRLEPGTLVIVLRLDKQRF